MAYPSCDGAAPERNEQMMNEERRRTIIREIEYWQENKLLPDQYCDFLMNLYKSDEEIGRSPSGWSRRAVSIALSASGRQWFLAFAIFSAVCFVVLYFNVFHPLLQTALALFAVVLLLFFGLKRRRGNEAVGLVLISLGMLTLLVAGIAMLMLHGLDTPLWTGLFLFGCGVFWIIFGIAARFSVLHYIGWLTIFLVYAMLLALADDRPRWYEVQLFWLPAAFVFGWFSWFVHRWSKPSSAVMFAASATLWFMPELYAALLMDQPAWIQLALIAKIAVGGGIIFALRKQWTEWVA
jgi:hypothetical protein